MKRRFMTKCRRNSKDEYRISSVVKIILGNWVIREGAGRNRPREYHPERPEEIGAGRVQPTS
jgi:hypothetical protein